MSHTAFKVFEIVNRAVSHEWSVPEFQRGFVWKAPQVRDLADSLWLDYPVGSILLWDSTGQKNPPEPRGIRDGGANLWLVDGQQRTTALCILSGRKPYWWKDGEAWNEVQKKYDVRFDVEAKEPPFFVNASAVIRAVKTSRYIPVKRLITLDLNKEGDRQSLQDIARKVRADGVCSGMDTMEVYTKLERVQRIRDREIVAVNVSHELEEVVDIFGRLNSKGTRVKETDIYLGVVAARDAGWVRDEFMPFLDKLDDKGLDISPNLLFQSVAAIGTNKARFREIDERFWTKEGIGPAWKKARQSWQNISEWLGEYGILSTDMLPGQSALITAAALFAKYPDVNKAAVFEWLVQALRYGRYSGASHTAIEEDIREIDKSSTSNEAVAGIRGRIRSIEPFEAEFFLRDYSDGKFGRLVLYVLMFEAGALDWDEGTRRIAFDGDKLAPGFEPQFHHIFPRKLLKIWGQEEFIDSIANVAIIGASTNLKIGMKHPREYFEQFKIGKDKYRQQCIDDDVFHVSAANYREWVVQRAQLLADHMNQLISRLRQ